MYPENKKASSGIYFILLFKMMKLQIPSQSLSRSRLMLLHSCHTDKKKTCCFILITLTEHFERHV